MKTFSTFVLFSIVTAAFASSAEPPITLEETFEQPLSADWHWGLGTWTAKDGVLRAFESGERRHGPVKVRRLQLSDAVIECEFRFIGKATFAGIIFNGPPERGHIVHFVMSRQHLRVIAHPQKSPNVDLLKQPGKLASDTWHRVCLEFKGQILKATVNDVSFTATHPCIAEVKQTFGLGGDSGGPEGEKAGALEFRRLKITANP